MASPAGGDDSDGGMAARDLQMEMEMEMECRCGAGLCRVQPVILNPRVLFICCPRGHADCGGCGFMQWRDTVDPDDIVTWIPPPPLSSQDDAPPSASHDSAPPSASQDSAPPLLSQGCVPPPLDSQDNAPPPPPPPPPPPQFMCPCGAGPCSTGLAKNGRSFYSCSACKFKKWCDDGSRSECFICRQEGHWSADCPRLPPSAAAAAADNKIICFYCKMENHYAAQCPLKRRRRRN